MTQFEVTSDMLSKVPQMKRPAHISDREFAETYRALANSIELENAGEPSVTVTWAELKQEMGIED